MTRAAAAGLAVIGILAAGCTTAQSPPMTEASKEAPAGLALEIVAEYLSVDADELELLRIEPVEWRDSGIGCPDPGMDYLHVITPGHFALVRDASGATHRVHMAGGSGFVCEQDRAKSVQKVQPLPTFSQSQLEALARADLARRLGVPPGEISLLGTRPTEWPDASLGCAGDEAAPAGGASKGFVVTLSHAGRRYTYHTDLRRAIPCPPIKTR
ncbi:MAG TPA: hypothetical protein VFG91_00655 [Woeseiaceae bacterium]|nr:hypothetical protein [Woeseiaceae bacterium]